MTTQRKIQQELFPDLPRSQQAVDKNGNMNQAWSLGFSNLFQSLQANFKREGIMLPPLTDSQITDIEDQYTPFIGQPYNTLLKSLPDISGQTIWDRTTSVPKVFQIIVDPTPPNNVLSAEWKTYVLL